MHYKHTLKTSYILRAAANFFVSFILQFKTCNQTIEGDQGIQIGRVQISLFDDDMIVHISDPKNFTKNLLH